MRFLECFLVALRLGLTSFGGPVAHLGFFHEEYVVRKRWLSEQRYAELLALCQFLPGPSSSQLGVAVGHHRAGLLGAVLAWLGFTLPSAILMVGAGYGIGGIEGPWVPGALIGLKCVAVAVVAHAWVGMRRSLCPDLPRVIFAAASLGLLFLLPGSLAVLCIILAGAMLGALLLPRLAPQIGADTGASTHGPNTHRKSSWLLPLLLLATFFALLTLSLLPKIADGPLGGAAEIYRAGSLVFGGGHVVLPMLEDGFVGVDRMPQETFLAGYGLAQALPGPLFTFAGYLGSETQLGGGFLTGGLLGLVAIFLPGFLLLGAAAPVWSRIRHHQWAQYAIAGANAVVVGVLGYALVRMATGGATEGWPEGLGIGAAFLMLLWGRLPVWLVVLLGGLIGALSSDFGG